MSTRRVHLSTAISSNKIFVTRVDSDEDKVPRSTKVYNPTSSNLMSKRYGLAIIIRKMFTVGDSWQDLKTVKVFNAETGNMISKMSRGEI